MAKGQKRSGREPKKPKADKKKPAEAGSAFSSLQQAKRPPAKEAKS